MKLRNWITAAGLVLGSVAAVQADRPLLVPAVKSVQWADGGAVAVADGAAAIVLGEKASPADHAAADMLQRYVAHGFGQKWAVAKESDELSRYKLRVLLGQFGTHAALKRICTEKRVELPAGEDGSDGYAIEVIADQGSTVVLAVGTNGRAVTYAQDTLFQLLSKQGDAVRLQPASIRDWASIPWRGRAMTDVHHFLEPGGWDCLVSSRLNWIDLRNGTYAYEPDYVFNDDDRKTIAADIAESHERGILVYGVVNVGVPADKYDAVMEKFRQFIAWGVDGLWLSFDDRGPGDHPEQITTSVLELGRAHGMTGNRIGITPPKGSYQTVLADFNNKIAKVPGMENTQWWFTPLPSEQFAADCRAIGLKTKGSWWHNWPRVGGGFTSIRGNNLNTDLQHTYLDIPSLAVGWHEPSYEMIADGAKYVQAALPWSGNALPQEYVATTFGWWAWSPEQHDWLSTRKRAYSIVYGPPQAQAMVAFDEKLVQVKALFKYGRHHTDWRPNCPARLKNLADRSKAMELLEQCERLAAQVAQGMPASTLLDAKRVDDIFVSPMSREVQVGKVCAAVEFPEYWWDEHQRQVLDAVYAGDLARADELISAARPRVEQDLAAIEQGLAKLNLTGAYVKWWKDAAGLNAAGWQKRLAARQALVAPRVWDYGYYSVLINPLLKNGGNVPWGWGRGGAERQMRVLATVLPEVKEQYWGDYVAGTHKEDGVQYAVFAMEPGAAARAGDFEELPVRVPISGQRDKLGILLYMNRWTKEKLGLEEVPNRWAGFTVVQLLLGDEVLWEGDVGVARTGCEWSLIKLPAIPADVKELVLRLRVVDRKDSDGEHAIVFVGPLRLVEMPGL